MEQYVIIVGAGMMGSGIAAIAALAGHRTVLIDISKERAKGGLEKAFQCIDLRRANDLESKENAEKAKSLIEYGTDISIYAQNALLVIEAIIENLQAKQKLFRELDDILPASVPICSNTSGLRITEISALCEKHAERTLTTHFWLPAHLVPLVEVVMGDKTSEAIAIDVRNLFKRWKKKPVLVRRDLPGQLANRIFQAVIREAIDIVESGLASAEDVDTAIAAGMAMRFPVWGPLMHLDAIGTDLGLSVQDTVLPAISCQKKAGTYLRQMVERGDLGTKTGLGFYDWNEKSLAQAMYRRDKFIIETCKVLDRLDAER